MVTLKPTRAGREGGFTLLEVMVALLIGMIGLLGTVALQQTMMRATTSANDQSVAMRLATQKLEELNIPQFATELDPLATGNWSQAEYLSSAGTKPDAGATVTRWKREWMIKKVTVGHYQFSVQITYDMDSGTPRVVRFDSERKTQ